MSDPTTEPSRVRTGTFTTMLAEFDWSCAPAAEPEVTAVRIWGPDGWEPCPKRMLPLLSGDPKFMADLRFLITPQAVPDVEQEQDADPCP